IAPKNTPVPRLDGLTLTLKKAGVVPELGFTESQLPLSLVKLVAVTPADPPDVRNVSRLWVWGTVLPLEKRNTSGLGAALKGVAPLLFTLITAGTITELVPDLTVMKPAYDPAVSDPAFAVTLSTCGVVPLEADKVNAFEGDTAAAVNITGAGPF